MKSKLNMMVAVASLALVMTLAASDEPKTITGEAKCAKCMLKEAKECQSVLQTEADGKTVTYYLVKNDVSKEFMGKFCHEGQKVTATGTIKKTDGKLELTPTKMELAKEKT